MKLPTLSLIVCLILAGCVHMREPNTIMVYKYDGSVQCEESGVAVEEMRLELTRAGVEVLCGRKAQDGRAYPAMCGAATGRINVYTIQASDLVRAQGLGFKSVETLPDAGIPPCNGGAAGDP
ncbi:MAG: hypothetical protein CMN57_03905 [Gammaproteobacteria bacterium]|nr:hypothetical protein [Gammaproteobacteria bacterium]